MRPLSGKHFLAALFLGVLCSLSGCGGGAGPSAPTDIPIPIEGLDGTSGVAVNSSFVWTPDAAVDTSTVTTSTFFIVPTLAAASGNISAAKSTFDATVCSASLALGASVSCDSSTSCTLNPTNDLEEGTAYTLCLTADILSATGEAITPVAISFVTTGDAFAVALVLDGAGQPLQASGTTGVIPTPMSIYLTGIPQETSGLVSFTCDLPSGSALAQPEHNATFSNALITITIDEAYKYQLLSCTLTISAAMTDRSGRTLGADASYRFTNGCALDDDFNADSQSCWTPATTGFDVPSMTWTTWAEFLAQGLLSFDPAAGELLFSDAHANPSSAIFEFGIQKDIVVGTGEINLYLHLTDIALNDYSDGVFIALILPNHSLYALGKGVESRTMGDIESCSLYYEDSVQDASAYIACLGNEYYLRLQIVPGASVKGFYAETEPADDSGWTEITGGDAIPIVSVSGEATLLLDFFGDNNGNAGAGVASVRATGITSETQY